MILAVVLLLGALLVSWAAPRLLEYRLRAGADAHLAGCLGDCRG